MCPSCKKVAFRFAKAVNPGAPPKSGRWRWRRLRVPVNNTLILSAWEFFEYWTLEPPFYTYSYDAIGDSQGWLLVYQDRLRLPEGGCIVLTTLSWRVE